MVSRIFAILILGLSMFVPTSTNAQNFHVNIHGHPFSCQANNGQQVPIFTDWNAAQAAASSGGARADYSPQYGYTIAMNVQMLSQTPPLAAVMVFFHECGHVALPPGVGLNSPHQERNADCWAAEQMVQQGYIQSHQDFIQAVTYVIQIGGMNGMTQSRINHMWQCAQ